MTQTRLHLLASLLLLLTTAVPAVGQVLNPLCGTWVDPTSTTPSRVLIEPGPAGKPGVGHSTLVPWPSGILFHPDGTCGSAVTPAPLTGVRPIDWALIGDDELVMLYSVTVWNFTYTMTVRYRRSN